MPEKFDFQGWATKFGVKCADGRTICKGAFSGQNGAKVPLVYQHNHKDLDNVLGHAILEERDEGMWAYCFLNDKLPKAKTARECVSHGDIDQLSIWANELNQRPNGDVMHGVIRELSLVLSGANSGARILFPTLAHSGDTVYDEAIIYSGETMDAKGGEYMSHSDDPKGDPKKDDKQDPPAKDDPKDNAAGDPDYKKIIDGMTPEQKDALYTMVGLAAAAGNSGGEAHAASGIDNNDGGKTMQTNAFDSGRIVGARVKPKIDPNNAGGALAHDAIGGVYAVEDVLSHDQLAAFFEEASHGSMKQTWLAHAAEYGIENIEYLFPDARNVKMPPDFIMRDQDWVSVVMNGTHHTPFSRIKSIHADITADEARARGYIKGNLKKEEVFTLLRRTTTPQTIYKKQKLDRDDIVDITDFDVVAWIKTEMRMMLNEEIARAILVGDGRPSDSEDKIQELNVRPIYKDTASDLYAMRRQVVVAADADEDTIAKAFIRRAIKARKDYKGSGNPVLFTTEDMVTDMLLLEDGIGHALYKTETELATKLRVSRIVTVPVMEGVYRETDDGTKYPLLGIIVNLSDYNVGADKGGAINMFDDFDIDYNQYKYLIETRISGALTKPKSAIVLELATTAASGTTTNSGTSSGSDESGEGEGD